jgi:hypothetical protein
MYTFVHHHRLKEAHNEPYLRSEMTVRLICLRSLNHFDLFTLLGSVLRGPAFHKSRNLDT